MLTSPFRVLRFDAFTLDLARSTLRRGDKALPLRRQSFDVLRCLAEHAGKVVSRDELIEAVWTAPPARPEDSVVQCIKDIRLALGDDTRWIVKTVPGRGYQLMAHEVVCMRFGVHCTRILIRAPLVATPGNSTKFEATPLSDNVRHSTRAGPSSPGKTGPMADGSPRQANPLRVNCSRR
jgi:DNA-binding winged helix-turn-helix (wHTH) protein